MTSNATTMTVPHTRTTPGLDRAALALLLGFVASLQVSIALANILLAGTLLGWVAMLVRDRARPSAPRILAAAARLRGRSRSSPRRSRSTRCTSLIDSKQLVLLPIVPAVYRPRARAAGRHRRSTSSWPSAPRSAAFGIIQYRHAALRQPAAAAAGRAHPLHDLLGRADAGASAPRWRGSSSASRDRIWPALVMPALVVALALTPRRATPGSAPASPSACCSC